MRVQARRNAARGHVASLNFVVNKWSVATGVEKGLLLKWWSHALLLVGNQPFGPAQNVSRAFGNVGKRYVARDGTWRWHQNKNETFVKWQKAAVKRALRRSSRAYTPSTKRRKQRHVSFFVVFCVSNKRNPLSNLLGNFIRTI